MNQFPPNLDPKFYTLSAIVIGYSLIGNFTANEQNAIGNWFMTIGQILENNATWQQVIEERIQGNTININSQKFKATGEPYMDNKEWVESPDDKVIDKLQEAIEMIKEQLDKMK